MECIIYLVSLFVLIIAHNAENSELRFSNIDENSMEGNIEYRSNDYDGDDEDDDTPDSIDWRSLGVETEVVDSRTYYEEYSWAFVAIDAIENQLIIKNRTLQTLSAQELIDCVEFEKSKGLKTVFYYILDKNISTEEHYPLTGAKDVCKNGTGDVEIGYFIDQVNESHIKRTVAKSGPVAAFIDGSGLPNYTSGISDGNMCNNTLEALNRAVLVVGYGIEDDQKYWILKNTWGADWGEKGYFKLARNVNNTCGIGTAGIFVGIF